MKGNKRNLYFDNAATSWPKPEPVYGAAEIFMRQMSGNPGRTGSTRTIEADRLVYQTRAALARLFHAPDPSRIVFALNATDALNMAIKGIIEPGDHVLFTAMEHNSVLRPLGGLKKAGLISATMIPCSKEGATDLDFLEKAFKPRTRLLIVNHASNVCGTIAPIDELIAIAHRRGAFVLVDAAQSAGVLPIDVQASQIDLLAFTGHKGLLGPAGTGGLYVRPGLDLKPWREGGTGSFSEMDLQPESMPERLEAGTLNSPGLAGLLEGVKFIEEMGLDQIRNREMELYAYLRDKLSRIPGIELYSPEDPSRCAAVLSLVMKDIDCGELGYILESAYGILCRTGLHCAPMAHRALGTFPEGTVRLSPGYFTRKEDIDYLYGALEEIAALKS
ncbi:MAG TPA: aminotransferase class V-fold PLP-dependent enzyme [Bacillota bacterium]|jgi:cysteine desulfurase/selenocysteine lyase|nr:aminotransferase class V-fold PLP-dependent enzyme [Bacillota bacterium]HOA35494.1 aminotransferase class V-fold PLP-dependent enzyme [Bacillota bacterium]HOJ84289.1 aminotransferase class V-fold PLP-dependent enzyme [Bacillota bacterium]HOL15491.1 aminotransferase class V-fold PLP-dependent enzyme [Bacillota bacterium]HPZ12472.1 aminotransferase class V-fold PLP-dependent enzyme [Bacillota bacterium]